MANEVDALVVKFEADLASFRAEMLAGQKVVQQSAQGIEKALAEMNQKSGGSFKFLRDAAATAAGFIGGAAVLGVIKKTAEAIKEFFLSGLDEAVKQEDAILRLNQALAQSGKYSQAATQEMQAFASSLQATTRFGDDAVLEVSALIQSLGRLDTEGLKGATTAALDLSTALGIDLQAAAKMVGKAAVGEVASFGKLGVEITKGKTDAETFANTLEALSRQFGGSAKNAVNTYSGATAQLGNLIGDAKEEFAGLFTTSGSVVSVIKVIGQGFDELAKFIKDNRVEIQGFIKDGIIMLADTIPVAVDAMHMLANSMGEVRKGTIAAAGGVAEIFEKYNPLIQVLKHHPLTKLMGGEQLSKSLKDFSAASEGAFAEEVKIQDERAVMFNKIKNKAQELRDKIVKAAEDGANAQAGMNAQFEKQSALAAINNEALNALTEVERTRLEAQIEAGIKLIEAEEVYNTDHMALLEERIQAEQDALDKANERGLLTGQQYEARKLAIATKAADDRVAVQKAEADRKHAIEQSQLKATSDVLGNTATIAKAFGKEGFAAYKGLAKAQALIDAYAGASAAFKATAGIPVIGPGLAPVAAAAALGAGLARVAQINAMQMAKGGEVPGIGFSDSQPAMLTPNEMVIDRSTTSRIKKFFGGENAMLAELQGLRAEIRAIGRMPERFQITDPVGRVIFDLMNSELRAGRRLAIGGV